jgi:hypothetical protein
MKMRKESEEENNKGSSLSGFEYDTGGSWQIEERNFVLMPLEIDFWIR